MKSAKRGKRTLAVEVTNVSVHGFWLLIDAHEHWVSFAAFPWFRDASIGQLVHVERPSPEHLYWPELDIDLALESIDHPERFPLVSAVGSAGVRGRKGATPRGTRIPRGRAAKRNSLAPSHDEA